MNTTLISMTIALLLGLGLIAGLVFLNLLTGALEFLFGKPTLEILKSNQGVNGLAFSLRWSNTKEPAKLHQARLRLFNPFGSPTQVDVSKEFEPRGESFAVDLDMGPGLQDLISAKIHEGALIMLEVGSVKDGVFHQFTMKAHQFFDKRKAATMTAEETGKKLATSSEVKMYCHTVEKSFIAPPMGGAKALKLATNPEFAGESAGAAGAGGDAAAAKGAPKENFAVSKVWIEPGCIVCNACENIYPEVFKVNADTCIVVPSYPKDDGLKVLEAAEACPVEVIKFQRA